MSAELELLTRAKIHYLILRGALNEDFIGLKLGPAKPLDGDSGKVCGGESRACGSG
jgi:hypothetical protein